MRSRRRTRSTRDYLDSCRRGSRTCRGDRSPLERVSGGVADERYGEGTVDEDLLLDAAARDEVVLTHDRDFAELAEAHDHAGILLSVSHSPDAGAIVRAIDNLLAVFTPGTLENELVYIDDWADP
jgi:hypothetical protein